MVSRLINPFEILAEADDRFLAAWDPARDERWAMIDLRATAFAGLVTVVAIIAAWLWEIAHGRDGDPYGQLTGIGGIAYVVAVALLRGRG